MKEENGYKTYTEEEVQAILAASQQQKQNPRLVSVIIQGVFENGEMTTASTYDAEGLQVAVTRMSDLNAPLIEEAATSD